MRPRRNTRLALAVGVPAIVLLGALLSPPAARAALPLPGLPFGLGLPSAGGLLGSLFGFFFRTFFGLEAKVTEGVVRWLLAAPVYTDSGAYGELNQLRSSVAVAGWALLTLVFAVSGVRYYASGLTSAGSYEALEALGRGGAAAGAMVVYPQVFGAMSVATNSLTYGITHAPAVHAGLTRLFAAASITSFTPLGPRTIAAVAAVVLLILLLVTKIVIATLLALLYVAAPLAIALWALPETAWLARTWFQSLLGLLLWPVIWALCFAIFAVMGAASFGLHGSVGSVLIKPWIAVAALFVAFKAPQLLARQAMLAGLTQSLGGTAARGLVYGRAALRAGGAASAGGGTAAGSVAAAG